MKENYMKSNLWTKTILTVYKYLERIAGAIDKLVERQAINSYYSNFANNGVEDLADKIIELSERKVKLINIKVLTENTLEKMEESSAQLLIEKYIDNDKSEIIAQRHNFPMRTYFRRQKQAEDAFTAYMALQGFSESKISEYLAGEAWIVEVFNNFKTKEFDEVASFIDQKVANF